MDMEHCRIRASVSLCNILYDEARIRLHSELDARILQCSISKTCHSLTNNKDQRTKMLRQRVVIMIIMLLVNNVKTVLVCF